MITLTKYLEIPGDERDSLAPVLHVPAITNEINKTWDSLESIDATN